jgi:hypothetical protein
MSIKTKYNALYFVFIASLSGEHAKKLELSGFVE